MGDIHSYRHKHETVVITISRPDVRGYVKRFLVACRVVSLEGYYNFPPVEPMFRERLHNGFDLFLSFFLFSLAHGYIYYSLSLRALHFIRQKNRLSRSFLPSYLVTSFLFIFLFPMRDPIIIPRDYFPYAMQ